jgi:hypothetical protein
VGAARVAAILSSSGCDMGVPSMLIVAAAVALAIEAMYWYRHGPNGKRAFGLKHFIGIGIIWPLIDLVRLTRWMSRNWWEWSAAPRVNHARGRWATRTVLKRKAPVIEYTAGAVLAEAGLANRPAPPAPKQIDHIPVIDRDTGIVSYQVVAEAS